MNTESVQHCEVCADRSVSIVHRNVVDRLFGAPGKWNYLKCRRCGTIRLDPRPIGEQVSLAYTEDYSNRKGIYSGSHTRLRRAALEVRKSIIATQLGYGHLVGRWESLVGRLLGAIPPIRRKACHAVINLAWISPDAHLLDIGCGAGQFLSAMKSLGWRVHGVDTDERVIRFCQSKNLEVTHGTLEQAAFADHSFDVVTMRHVVEHISSPASLFQEISRILKPSGKLVVTTPNAESICHQDLGNAWLGLDVSRHVNIFNTRSLGMLAKQAGLSIESITTSAQITLFVAETSHAMANYGINAYKRPTPLASKLFAYIKLLKTKLAIARGIDSGDEIMMVARKP